MFAPLELRVKRTTGVIYLLALEITESIDINESSGGKYEQGRDKNLPSLWTTNSRFQDFCIKRREKKYERINNIYRWLPTC